MLIPRQESICGLMKSQVFRTGLAVVGKDASRCQMRKGRCDKNSLPCLGPPTGLARSEESIVDNLLTFLFAGQDSTAAAMASCLCYLCSNPDCKDPKHMVY